jgi:DNA-binding MarR family transcriptional regulator
MTWPAPESERPPDVVLSEQERAYVALLCAADRLQGEFASWLKPHGLSPTQYNVLRILRGAGKQGLPCTGLGARMMNRDPDITRLLDRLEKRGLVQRSRASQMGAWSGRALRRRDSNCSESWTLR